MTALNLSADEYAQIRDLRNRALITQLSLEQLTAAVQAGLLPEARIDLLCWLAGESDVGEPTITSLLGELVAALTANLQTSSVPGHARAARQLTAAAA